MLAALTLHFAAWLSFTTILKTTHYTHLSLVLAVFHRQT